MTTIGCLPIYLSHSHIRVYFGTGLLLYEGIGNVQMLKLKDILDETANYYNLAVNYYI